MAVGGGSSIDTAKAAQFMGVDVSGADPMDGGDILANAIIELIQKIHIPNGLRSLGYITNQTA